MTAGLNATGDLTSYAKYGGFMEKVEGARCSVIAAVASGYGGCAGCGDDWFVGERPGEGVS